MPRLISILFFLGKRKEKTQGKLTCGERNEWGTLVLVRKIIQREMLLLVDMTNRTITLGFSIHNLFGLVDNMLLGISRLRKILYSKVF